MFWSQSILCTALPTCLHEQDMTPWCASAWIDAVKEAAGTALAGTYSKLAEIACLSLSHCGLDVADASIKRSEDLEDKIEIS